MAAPRSIKVTITTDGSALRRDIEKSLSNLPVNISSQALAALESKLKSLKINFAIDPNDQSFARLLGNQGKFLQQAGQMTGINLQLSSSAKKAANEFSGLAERIGYTTSRLFSYLVPASLFFAVSSKFTDAARQIVTINDAVVRLSQSFGNNIQVAQKVAENAAKIGAKYGQSAEELIKLSAELARSGLYQNAKDVGNALDSIAASRFSVGLDKIGDSVGELTASLRALGLAGKDTKVVLDTIAKLSANSPVEAKDFLSAARYSGADFKKFGGNQQQFNALIATLGQVTHLPATTTGASLEYILTNLAKPQTLAYLNRYTQGGIYGEGGQLKDINGILESVAGSSKGASRSQLSGLVQKLGGEGVSKVLIPLLSDINSQNSQFSRYNQLASNAGGTVDVNAYFGSKTIKAQIDSVGATFTQALTHLSDDPSLKKLVTSFTDLSKSSASLVANIGPLLPVFTTLATTLLGMYAIRNAPNFLAGISRYAGNRNGTGTIGAAIFGPESAYGQRISTLEGRRARALESRTENELNYQYNTGELSRSKPATASEKRTLSRILATKPDNLDPSVLNSALSKYQRSNRYGYIGLYQDAAEAQSIDETKGIRNTTSRTVAQVARQRDLLRTNSVNEAYIHAQARQNALIVENAAKIQAKNTLDQQFLTEQGRLIYSIQEEKIAVNNATRAIAFSTGQLTPGARIKAFSQMTLGKLSDINVKGGQIASRALPYAIPVALDAGINYFAGQVGQQQSFLDGEGNAKANAYSVIQNNKSNNKYQSVLSSAGSFGLAGALLGTEIAPGLGTVVGGTAGAGVGAVYGYLASLSKGAQEASEALLLLASTAKDPKIKFERLGQAIREGGSLNTSLSDQIGVGFFTATRSLEQQNQLQNLLGVQDTFRSEPFQNFLGNESSRLSDKYRSGILGGKNSNKLRFSLLQEERGNIVGAAKAGGSSQEQAENLADLAIFQLSNILKSGSNDIEKSLKVLSQVLDSGGSSFNKFFFDLNRENQSAAVFNQGNKISGAIASQGIAGVFGRGGNGFQTPGGIPELVYGQIQAGIQNGGNIGDIIKSRTTGLLNTNQQNVIGDLFRVQGQGQSLISEALRVSGGDLKDLSSTGDISSFLQQRFNNSLNSVPFKSSEGRNEANTLFSQGLDKLFANNSPESVKKLLQTDPQQLLSEILPAFKEGKPIIDKFNNVLNNVTNQIEDANRSLQIFTNLLEKQNEYESKRVSVVVEQLGRSRSVGGTDLSVLAGLNKEINSRSLPGFGANINGIRSATNNVLSSQGITTAIVKGSGIGDIGKDLIDQAKAFNNLSQEQSKFQYNISRTNDVLVLMREKFTILNALVQQNIDANKKIGELNLGQRIGLGIQGRIAQSGTEGFSRELSQYGISNIRGLLQAPESIRNRVLSDAASLGSNPLLQRSFGQSSLLDDRYQNGIRFGDTKDIIRYGLGNSVQIPGLTDRTQGFANQLGSSNINIGTIENDQLTVQREILGILRGSFGGPISETRTSGAPILPKTRQEFFGLNPDNTPKTSNIQHNVDVKANVNIDGFENVGKEVASFAIVTSVMENVSQTLKQTGDPSSLNFAASIDIAIKQLSSQFKSGQGGK